MNRESTILLVDDHPMMRKGLRVLIEQEEGLRVVGEAGDGHEGIDQVRQLQPDVVVMDINMPNLNGIDATRQILKESPKTRVLALSINSGKHFVEEMIEAGASGYLLKLSAPEELILAINALLQGKGYLSADITETVLSRLREGRNADTSTLSDSLATKLYRPRLATEVVHRPKLIQQLESGVDKKLTLLVAPTGYGKSTLVSDWLNHCAVQSAWLALDSEDNDLRQFLKNLIAAIQHLNPGAFEQLPLMMQSATLPPVLVLASELIVEIEKLTEPFILAIDNFHEIKNKLIHDLLSHFLSAPKSSMHLLLITRQSPFLPLDVLRSGNDISELRVQDLSFSEQDTAALLGQAFDQTVDDETAKAWLGQTDGWVSALVLMIEKAKATDGGSLQTPGFRGGDLPPVGTNGPDPDSSATDNSITWREILTNREYEILLLLEDRLRDKEIADRLGISPETVRSHLKNLYSKLHANDRRDAIVKATRLGLLVNT